MIKEAFMIMLPNFWQDLHGLKLILVVVVWLWRCCFFRFLVVIFRFFGLFIMKMMIFLRVTKRFMINLLGLWHAIFYSLCVFVWKFTRIVSYADDWMCDILLAGGSFMLKVKKVRNTLAVSCEGKVIVPMIVCFTL